MFVGIGTICFMYVLCSFQFSVVSFLLSESRKALKTRKGFFVSCRFFQGMSVSKVQKVRDCLNR